MKFSAMLRLMEMIPEWDKRANGYANKLADALEGEGYVADAKVVRDHIKWRNGEDVAMAVMDKTSDEPETTEGVKELRAEVIKFNRDHFEELHSDMETIDIVHIIARHFAEWGAEHLAKQS